ncbi:YdcH family protein [Oceanicella sp. SM1341]|uniref:YdcH family protein n=1 Tax=Oceanicella sp. SM1341 TaxID=1548889 RepID=UPI000E50E24B|nr:DUF465 domain-containing protein [Oceanicella sp. SM1341]
MNSTPPQMSREDILRIRLDMLRREHRDLDQAIAALDMEARADMLTIRRLKKRKLSLKDEISRIEDVLTPDIIA